MTTLKQTGSVPLAEAAATMHTECVKNEIYSSKSVTKTERFFQQVPPPLLAAVETEGTAIYHAQNEPS